MTILAWLFAVAGVAVAFVVSLAGAMKSVPRLDLLEALPAVPLPLLAIVLAVLRLRALQAGRAGSQVAALIPLGIAALTLLFVMATYLGQPGRR